MPVDPGHLMLTNGSMQAVTLVAEALQDAPGDTCIIEEFSYPGTLAAYRSLGLDMVGIPLSEDGMRLDVLTSELDRLAGDGPTAEVHLHHHHLSESHRLHDARSPSAHELIDIARRFDVPVVEDNCYGDVHYEGPVAPAIYALDDDPRHIYLCSLSKILAPGLRLGYVVARPPMLEKIMDRRHDAGGNTCWRPPSWPSSTRTASGNTRTSATRR